MQEQQPQPIRKRRVRPNHRPKILFHPSKMDTIVNAIYTYYDCDRSEFLKKTEFAKVLSKLIRDMGGDPPSMEDIEDIIFELDVNGDGQISKEQFRLLMEKVIQILDKDAGGARFIGIEKDQRK